jgi:glycosyltransferase involved in cell wall biosynthesis
MSTPRVSVICASYNHERYVEAAIRSVLEQSFRDLELIVVDDGSSDGTAQRVAAIGDPRISLHVLPRNEGACAAMNHAIRRARGEYVAVLNSDDLFLPGKIERQVAVLDAEPAVAAVFAHPTFIDERGAPLIDEAHKDTVLQRAHDQPRRAWLRQLFRDLNCLCHPSVLIRKRVYDEVGLLEPAMAQLPDLDLWVRVLLRFEIRIIAEPLVAFRVRDGQANASAARPEVLVRDAFEQRLVLRRYLALPDDEVERVFPEAHATDRGMPVGWRIGRLALEIARPAAVQFGLEAMYDALAAVSDPARHREFIALSGRFDPLGTLAPMSADRRLAPPAPPPLSFTIDWV